MVFYRKGVKFNGSVAFYVSDVFRNKFSAKLNIAGKTFPMITDGKWSWLKDVKHDPVVIEAMLNGSELSISSQHSRRIAGVSTFSLRGFASAHADTKAACGKQ